MGNGILKHSRATSGGKAAARTTQRYYLRRIVSEKLNQYGAPIEVLECGHEQRPVSDMIGPTSAERRRCKQCPRPECIACDGTGWEIYKKEPGGIDYRRVCTPCKGSGVIPSPPGAP